MSLRKLEKHMQAIVDDSYGEHMPVINYLIFAIATDGETMTDPLPVLITPDGQWPHVTDGLIAAARKFHEAEADTDYMSVIWDDDDSEDG